MGLIKLLIKYALNAVLCVFRVFPIKSNAVMLINDLSYTYGDNLKYLCAYLARTYPKELRLIYPIRKDRPQEERLAGVPAGVRVIPPGGLRFFYFAMTSRVLVTNAGGVSFLPLRKRQMVVNTWHGGGAYKKVGTDVRRDPTSYRDIRLTAKKTTYMLSSSAMFTEVMARSMLLDEEKFLNTGMPRNDVFFGDAAAPAGKVRRQYGLGDDERIVLYAPTFRNSRDNTLLKKVAPESALDSGLVLRALTDRFGGGWRFALRLHPMVQDGGDAFSAGAVNMSAYPDMQELLCAVDVLITDYSSIMWDFSLTEKPCFLYAEDIYQYEQTRGFYTEVSSWPFPVALDGAALEANIRGFDADAYRDKVRRHHETFGSYEQGTASKQLGDRIASWCRPGAGKRRNR